MGLLAYLPHLVYATALTSTSMHHLHARKRAEGDAAHVAAQRSLLVGLRDRLLSGERVPGEEFDRLWRLARGHDVFRGLKEEEGQKAEGAGDGAEGIGWKEVVFGKRFDTSRTEELDRADLEKGTCCPHVARA